MSHLDSILIAKCSDTILGALLMSMHKEGQIQSIMMSKCPDQKFHSTLPNLLLAFEDLVNRKLEVKEIEGTGGLDAYNETTCYKFHQLVVATVSVYQEAFTAYIEAEKTLTSQRDCADRVVRENVKQEKAIEKVKVKTEKMVRKEKSQMKGDLGVE